MKSTIKCFLFSLAIFFANGAPALQNFESELILVSVIFRHGARTTYAFYPSDPNSNDTFYPIGLGGLTNEGKMGEFKLGTYLKNLYGDFLGQDYTEDFVDVRSTDVTRTKMSAQLVLAGLFPPSKVQQWNKELNWQPIPVSYKSEAEEDLFHPWKTCPYKKNIIDYLPEIQEIQEIYIKPYNDVFQYIQNKSGKIIQHPADVQDIFFIFKTESDMGLITPKWISKIYPEPSQSIAALSYGYHNYDFRVKQINSGYMLKKILDDSKEKIAGISQKRIYLYSGHESTLGYMLNALNVDQKHVPPYGSAISFEIHKLNDEFFVKVRYRNDTEATEPVDLIVPGCNLLCPFQTFLELQKNLIPTISIQEACGREQIDDADEINRLK